MILHPLRFLTSVGCPRRCWTTMALAFVACANDTAATFPKILVENLTVLVSTESELLARPADITIDESGLSYVVDMMASQVLVVTGQGEHVRTIGEKGGGSREFRTPCTFALAPDTLHVADVGNRRPVVETSAGGHPGVGAC